MSTIAALVVAATGAKVCKHGGRACVLGRRGGRRARGAGRCGRSRSRRRGPVHGRGRAWGSASRRASTRPCGSPARCARTSAFPRCSTTLARWPTRAGPSYQVIGVSDPAMADKMLGVLAANGDTAGHGRLRRRRSRRAEHHRAFHRARADRRRRGWLRSDGPGSTRRRSGSAGPAWTSCAAVMRRSTPRPSGGWWPATPPPSRHRRAERRGRAASSARPTISRGGPGLRSDRRRTRALRCSTR